MSKVELSDPIALRIPVDVLGDIERIAAVSERTRSWVIVRALRLYLASEGADCLAIIRAREEAAEGGGHDADDALGELESIVRSKLA
jgi:predicted transcriptional regulator